MVIQHMVLLCILQFDAVLKKLSKIRAEEEVRTCGTEALDLKFEETKGGRNLARNIEQRSRALDATPRARQWISTNGGVGYVLERVVVSEQAVLVAT
ncbi:hypothetical protein K1719_018684 [Acacia pycnantha]|nr:hypothetical protein K1719_018684 [Acacia pycnantha]